MSRKAPKILAALALAAIAAVSSRAFKPAIHANITRTALASISVSIPGVGPAGFTETALDQLAAANVLTDLSASYFVPYKHVTDETLAEASAYLIAARKQVVALLSLSPPDGCAARERLGSALHTIQDFYAHSNWLELTELGAAAGIDERLGRSIVPNPPASAHFCAADQATLVGNGKHSLTTAYFVGLTGCSSVPAGKCNHGTFGCSAGIAKDKGVPAAENLARKATIDYVEQILADSAVAGNADALKALLGLRYGTFAVVIDDTGSMSEEIASVQATVHALVDQALAADIVPEQFLLVRYGDPDVGPPLLTTDPMDFLDAVDGLYASGGGDCPELAERAVLEAILHSKRSSTIRVFTDASSKDGYLKPAVWALAKLHDVVIDYCLSGSCSPIDPVYYEIASKTGGQVFVASPAQVGELLGALEGEISGPSETLVDQRGTLTAGGATIAVAVDTSIERLVLSASFDVKQSLQVLRPNGAAVAPSDPDVEFLDIADSCVVTISAPAPGTWSAQLLGSGSFTFVASGITDIGISRCAFVDFVEGSHGGYCDLDAEPGLNTSSHLLARLTGDVLNPQFFAVATDGAIVQPLPLSGLDPDAEAGSFVGLVAPGAAPFRAQLKGVDASGFPVVRTYPGLFSPQPVVVRHDAIATPNFINGGASATVTFEVANLGSATTTFQLSAADNLGFIQSIVPTSVALAAGAVATVDVQLTADVDALASAVESVTLTAKSASNAAVFNSSTAVLEVNGAPDCLAALDTEVVLKATKKGSFKKLKLGKLVKLEDPEGDAFTLAIDSITQDEEVDAAGAADGKTTPDAKLLAGGKFRVRRERHKAGNGRVYAVKFTATDARGASCPGVLFIQVPLDAAHPQAIDDGQDFLSAP